MNCLEMNRTKNCSIVIKSDRRRQNASLDWLSTHSTENENSAQCKWQLEENSCWRLKYKPLIKNNEKYLPCYCQLKSTSIDFVGSYCVKHFILLSSYANPTLFVERWPEIAPTLSWLQHIIIYLVKILQKVCQIFYLYLVFAQS